MSKRLSRISNEKLILLVLSNNNIKDLDRINKDTFKVLADIKLEENGVFDFDYLVYVLVDDYGFHIFEITGEDMEKHVKDKKFKGWSDKHGSKETGKNGQFTIRSESLGFHKSFLKKTVSWQEILELSKDIHLKKKKA